ncbi:MAG: sulfotransferase [Pseudomonadota bacterium]
MKRKPETFFFCIGAQKAGTTWLYQYLSQHPDVELGPAKELHYFNSAESGLMPDRARKYRDRAWTEFKETRLSKEPLQSLRKARAYHRYARLFERPVSAAAYRQAKVKSSYRAKVVGDITPAYALVGADSFRMMDQVHSDVRYLYLLRDPVARYWSALRMLMKWRNIPKDISGDAVWRKTRGIISKRGSNLETRSDYAKTIKTLQQLISANRVKFMFYEDLFGPDKTSYQKEICAFLGINYVPSKINRRVHRGIDYVLTEKLEREIFEIVQSQYVDVPQLLGTELPEAWVTTHERLCHS